MTVQNSKYSAICGVFFLFNTSYITINELVILSETTVIEIDTDPIETGIQMMITIVIDTDQKDGTNILKTYACIMD